VRLTSETVKNLDALIFSWIAAGYTPDPGILPLAMSAALWGSWLAAMALAWAAWKHPTQRLYLVAALSAAAFSGMLAHGIAANWTFPRPFMLGLSPAYIPHGSRGSLPSTHATVLFTLAAIMSLRPILRSAAIGMALIALATAWGRIYCGIHFPLDILAGAILAAGVTLAFYACSRTAAMVVGPRIAGLYRRE
jgi:membrane-associated phospholipid phosphatase